MILPLPVKYLLRVWVTSILLSPFLYCLAAIVYRYIRYHDAVVNFEEIPLVIVGLMFMGLLFSIPIFFIMLLLIFKIDSIKRPYWKKILVALFTLCFISLAFGFGFGFKNDIITHPENNIELFFICGPYFVVSLGCIFFYRLK